MRHLRRFLLLAFGAVLLSSCGREGASTLSSGLQGDLAKLPQEVQTVFYADVQSLQNSELGQEFRKLVDSTMEEHHRGEHYKEFMEATGLDPRKDVHAVLVGMQANLEAGSDSARHHIEGAAFAIIKGDFDENKIVSFIQAKEKEKGKAELVIKTYNGKTLYTGPREKQAAYFADANTVVIGTEEWLQSVIDNKLEGKNLPVNAGMMKLINQLPHKNQLWAVGMPGSLMERITSELSRHEEFKAGHALRSLQSGMVSAQVNATADIWASATCSTEEDSRLMSDALKGALAMAKLAVSDDRDFVDMLNRFEIEAKGTEVHVSGKIDKVFLEKLKEKRMARRMAAI